MRDAMVIILGGIDCRLDPSFALSAVLLRLRIKVQSSDRISIIAGILIGLLVCASMDCDSQNNDTHYRDTCNLNIVKGFAYVYTGGSPVRVVTKEWQFIGAGYIGSVPTPVVILVIVLIITGLIMNKTKLGRHIYAVGGNAQAAEFSGIKVARVKFLVHTFSGIMAGLAGVVLASRMYSGQPTAGDGAEMDAIAAVVVGGTSMAGGSGKIGGTIIGGLIIGVLNNGLNLLNVNSFWQYVVKGAVILLAVFIDYLKNKKANA